MQEVGRILNFSKNKKMILEASDALELEQAIHLLRKQLVTEKFENIGRVKDIFGPAKNPFISVEPSATHPEKLIGKKAFIKEVKNARHMS